MVKVLKSNPLPIAFSTSAFIRGLLNRSVEDLSFQGDRDRNHSLTFPPLRIRPPFSSRFDFCSLLVVFHVRGFNLTEIFQYVQDIFTIRPIAIEYQNGIAASEIFRCDRRGAALWARLAEAARGSTRAFPTDSGFGEGTRLQPIRAPPARSEIECSRQAIPGRCAPCSPGAKRSGCACRQSGERPFRHAACRVYRECIMARRCSGFLPAIPGAPTRRRTAASTRCESGTIRGNKIRPFGCRVRQFHAKLRSGIGPTSRGQTTRRTGCSQEASAHKAQEAPPARPDGCAVCLVPKAGKPRLLRSADPRIL